MQFAKYLQNVEISLLIIKKHAIFKQQQQLMQYFMQQPEGVIIYNKKVNGKGAETIDISMVNNSIQ